MSRISIIIPTYQHAETIGFCLDSVLAQTRKPDEIIVVDDGSTDKTQAALEPYLLRGVRVIKTENRGSNPARNTGFAASTGDLVIFCDADVWMRPEMLQRLASALDDRPGASYAYSAFRFGWKRMPSYPFDAPLLRRMNYIHTTALVRREHFPGFDEAIRRFQDWDVWLTMLEDGHVGTYVPEELFSILDMSGRAGISQWFPSILLHVPWERLGWAPAPIRKYLEAKAVIVEKHGLRA
ncbi:glycosyltransferase family 2 protein [Patescibacteria group bacterium]|nr:MAG: glycosyltransferase family 2 protein [Patescibacteria group bacterium]